MQNTIYSIEEIKAKLNPIFSAAPVYKATLFGSYAKGSANERSDIDIVIDSHGELINWDFCGVLEDITQTLEKNIDLLEVSEIRETAPILNEIKNKGVLLYEKQG